MQARGIGPWESPGQVAGGAGGGATVGDLFYGDLRRPFTAAGMWGLQRVMSDATCPIRPLDNRGCTGSSEAFITLDATAPATLITQAIPALPAPVVGVKPAAPAHTVRRTVLPPARGGQAMPVRVAPVARCKPATRVAGHCSPKKAGTLFSDHVRPLPAPGAGG